MYGNQGGRDGGFAVAARFMMKNPYDEEHWCRPGLGKAGRLAAPLALVAAFAGACSDDDDEPQDPNDLALIQQVLQTNADVAFAAYSDAVTTVEALDTAIDAFLANPSEMTFAAAKTAWLAAREPYGQTEVYRFRASPIDDTDYDPSNGEDGPEGEINAWPLGEALLDYVVKGTDFGDDQVGVSAHSTPVTDPNAVDDNIVSDKSIPVSSFAILITNTLTAEDERDVLTGYHAVEFLLWGQDLNADAAGADSKGARDATAGQRPYTDYLTDAGCTSGGPPADGDAELCERRAALLEAVMAKLVIDIRSVRDAWAVGATYRETFTSAPDLATGKQRLLEILTGMGTLSEGELAGERMQIALSADSQEDEHSCFSDNTHRDIWLNAEGVSNVFFGRYAGYDSDGDGVDDATGSAVNGYGLDDYLTDVGQGTLASNIASALSTTETAYQAIDANARAGKPVDVVIMDLAGADAMPMRNAIVGLNAQATQIARIATELDLGTVDDVIDPDASECDTSDPTTDC